MFRKHSQPRLAARQRGYTLIEAGFAIVIATVIAAAGMTVVSKKADTMRVEKAQQEMKQWLEASMQYRRDTGAWPANTAALTAGNYMPSTSVNGPFGGAYTVAPVAGNARVRVTYNALETKFANLISASLPLANVTGTTVTGEVVVPGAESAHDALLPRDGSRAMTGNLNMGGNSISNASTIEANSWLRTPGYMQADLFYDYYNSGYYMRPRSVSRMNEVHADRVYGFSDIRTPILYDYDNTGYYTDPSYISNMNYVWAASDMRAPRFYDQNNTNYYLDPASMSRVNDFRVDGLYDYGKGAWHAQAVHHVYSSGHGDYIPKPSCAQGTPQIFTAVSSMSQNGTANPIGGVQTFPEDVGGGYWRVYMHLYTADGLMGPAYPYGQILVITKC
jgi:type II secretory pathway pseudopilin PulG